MIVQFSDIIAIFALIVGVYNTWKALPISFAKKINISNFKYGEHFGDKADGSFEYSLFTIDFTNTYNEILSLKSASLKVKYNNVVKYLPIIAKITNINPGETQQCPIFIYGISYPGEFISRPEIPFTITGKENDQEMDLILTKITKNKNKLHKRFMSSADAFDFLQNKIKQEFGINKSDDIIGVCKTFELSMIFETILQTNHKIENKIYHLPYEGDEFKKFISDFNEWLKNRK